LRDVFGAFFFVNFGLALDVSSFGGVILPVAVAVVLTLIVNTAGGQLIAWQNKLTPAEGLNVSAMLQNRGEFALILATLAVGAGLDTRLTPFAGLYVLIMAIVGPVLAVNSERIGLRIFRTKKSSAPTAERDRMRAEGIALVEAATAGQLPETADDDEGIFDPIAALDRADAASTEPAPIARDRPSSDPRAGQAAQQSDEVAARKRDPEY
jgi:CPA2 family monovalent cation:H+ antiporter-2